MGAPGGLMHMSGLGRVKELAMIESGTNDDGRIRINLPLIRSRCMHLSENSCGKTA